MIRPIGDWILVRPDQKPAQAGALYLSVTTGGSEGVVVALSSMMSIGGELLVGDRVLYDAGMARGAGTQHPDLVMVNYSDLRGVLAEVSHGN